MSSRNAAFHDGALAGVLLSPLKLAFSLAFGLVALLLCAWFVDWVFVFKVWPQGIERLRELLAHDLKHGIALAAQQGGGAGAITAPANGTRPARPEQARSFCSDRTRTDVRRPQPITSSEGAAIARSGSNYGGRS